MQIDAVSSGNLAITQASYGQKMQDEETSEARNGTTEETQGTNRLVKSAEQDRGLGKNIDLTA
jgi:hypothetical protein